MLASRRELLAGIAGIALAGSRPAAGRSGPADGATATDRRANAGRPAQRDEFDPAVHGFGFRNWSTREAVFATHDHDAVDEAEVRRLLGRRWERPARRTLGVDVLGLSDALLAAITKQVYVSVNQLSGTNGHCYGMVFAAQQYYEDPGSVPLDRGTASEFDHPEAPVDDPETGPVARDVDHYHLTQFLDFRSWLGRRAMAWPSWIDYRRQLNRVTAAIDEFGTAGLTVFDSGNRASHQVLAYDYRRTADATRLFVYDPNYPAGRYARSADPPAVVVDTSGSRPAVRPYGNGYDEFVFDRRGRASGTRPDGGADQSSRADQSGRADPVVGPPDDGNPESLFDLALFLVDSPDVALTVVGPDGRAVGRDTATYSDRSRTAYARMRYRYGFAPGRYDVRVVGEADAEYALRAVVADAEGPRLDVRRTRTIEAGEVHRYAAAVPEAGTGSLDRLTGGRSWRGTLGAVGLGAGVAGVAAGAYARLRGRAGNADDSAGNG